MDRSIARLATQNPSADRAGREERTAERRGGVYLLREGEAAAGTAAGLN